jgi:D-alanine-D-alanine ligase
MRIELITTPNHHLKETGFGTSTACADFVRSALGSGIQIEARMCRTLADLHSVVDRRPDLVVLAVKYLPLAEGENLWLAKFFEEHKISYTGSGSDATKVSSNKVLAKTMVSARGIRTASFFLATPGKYAEERELPLPFPLFVKPMDAANGNGIDDDSVVRTFEEYERKVQALAETYPHPALVEQYLDGAEYTVSLLQTELGAHLAPIEIIPPESGSGVRILGAEVKQENTEALKKIEDPAIHGRVGALALQTFAALGAQGFARIDIKSDSQGRLFFLEANLVPGMKRATSYFPRALELDSGLCHTDVVRGIIEFGLGPVLGPAEPGSTEMTNSSLAASAASNQVVAL